MKICPSCEEPLKYDAIVCTHCGHQLADIPAAPTSGARRTADASKVGCGLVILGTVVLLLWAFSALYQQAN